MGYKMDDNEKAIRLKLARALWAMDMRESDSQEDGFSAARNEYVKKAQKLMAALSVRGLEVGLSKSDEG